MVFALQALNSTQSSSPLQLGWELKENPGTLALPTASLESFPFGFPHQILRCKYPTSAPKEENWNWKKNVSLKEVRE